MTDSAAIADSLLQHTCTRITAVLQVASASTREHFSSERSVPYVMRGKTRITSIVVEARQRSSRLSVVGLGAGRRSAVLAKIFVQIPGREHEQESLPCRGRHSAGRAIEQRGIQRSELVRLFRGIRSWRSSYPGG